jgi:hypothetical protein
MKKILPLFACIIFLIPSIATAFGLTGMTPHLSDFETQPGEDIVLIFDAALDPATAIGDNVYLESGEGELIAATLTLSETEIADDTLIIDPIANLAFGSVYRVVIAPELLDVSGVDAFDGEFPDGIDWFVPNVPYDLERPVWDPENFTGVFVNSNVLLGFNPLDPESTDPAAPQTIPGINCTGAWKIHTGRPEIIIADLDNGLADFHEPELADRFFINTGELPTPQDGGTPCAYDCNGDGRISCSDYLNDPRVTHDGRAYVDPQDLIDAFADGVDGDANGFVDDISGWDFFRNVNTPYGVREFEEGIHSNQISRAAVAQADNASGNKPGACPDCSIMSVRVTDGLIADLDALAAAADYAVDMGAKVLMVALGGLDYSDNAMQSFIDAYEQGTITIAASGDTMGFQHLYPAAGEDVIDVKGVMPLPPVPLGDLFTLDALGFVESYCTNYGARIDHTVSTGACTSESVGLGGGLAGLIYSYALELGIDLSAGEVRQIMNMTVDDIKDHCLTMTPGGCKEGWDLHFGYGRVNAERALMSLGVPSLSIIEKIPPDVRITSPLWWTTVDPLQQPTLDIEGQISARGREFDYVVQIAMGGEPDDEEFITVGSGTSTGVDGLIAYADIASNVDLEALKIPAQTPWEKMLTIRVQATYTAGDGQAVLGEARKAIAVNIDDDPNTGLMPGFPMYLGRSGEGSPVLYDLDGDPDGALEIVLATSNATIEVYKRDAQTGEFAMASGFPVNIDPPALYEDGHIGSPMVADLMGDGVPVIVTATVGGRVYAVWPDGNDHDGGAFLPGFPVLSDPRPSGPDATSFEFGHGNGFMSAPTLADLDGDGVLDIIAAGYDQKLYAWKPVDEDQDGEADRMPGWPVLLQSNGDQVPEGLVCDRLTPAQVLASPAVGILDPDSEDPDISEYPSVVIGTTEVCEGELFAMSRLYAVFHDGTNHAGGPFLPGWPVATPAPLGDAMPIPPLTVGTTSSPAILVTDDMTYIGTGTFFFLPVVVRYKEGRTTTQMLWSTFNLTDSSAGLWGAMEEGGDPWYFTPTAGVLNKTDGYFWPLTFNVLGWPLGEWFGEGFRKRLDDIQFLHNPIMADLDGDSLQELISGSMGYTLYAWNLWGGEPQGWPKYTQHAHLGSPAVGDIDGDGKFEVVAHTHEGWLFAWEAKGQACRPQGINAEWWSFHHDERNTGLHGYDTLPPAIPGDLRVYFTDNPNEFEIVVTAPGDDWMCGYAADYDLRYTTGSGEQDFAAATPVDAPTPIYGGHELRFIVTAPDAAAFAMRAEDENGYLGHISPFVQPTTAPPETDDDSDDDDTTGEDDDASDDDDDDDDDDGCCGC